jgi:hypothetical protein
MLHLEILFLLIYWVIQSTARFEGDTEQEWVLYQDYVAEQVPCHSNLADPIILMYIVGKNTARNLWLNPQTMPTVTEKSSLFWKTILSPHGDIEIRDVNEKKKLAIIEKSWGKARIAHKACNFCVLC